MYFKISKMQSFTCWKKCLRSDNDSNIQCFNCIPSNNKRVYVSLQGLEIVYCSIFLVFNLTSLPHFSITIKRIKEFSGISLMILSLIRFNSLSLKMLSCFRFSNLEMEQVEQDPDFIMLSRQFKATAMELISVLELVNLVTLTLLTLTEKHVNSIWALNFIIPSILV